jgi:hypothetical protein
MMTEEHPFAHRVIILTIKKPCCRGGRNIIPDSHLRRNKTEIKPVGQSEKSYTADHKWHRIHVPDAFIRISKEQNNHITVHIEPVLALILSDTAHLNFFSIFMTYGNNPDH